MPISGQFGGFAVCAVVVLAEDVNSSTLATSGNFRCHRLTDCPHRTETKLPRGQAVSRPSPTASDDPPVELMADPAMAKHHPLRFRPSLRHVESDAVDAGDRVIGDSTEGRDHARHMVAFPRTGRMKAQHRSA